MKKALFVFIIVMISGSLHAQLKVLSNGTINLGNPTNDIFTVDYTGYYGVEIVLYPTSNYANAWLGKSGKGFHSVYTFNTLNPSDFRLKENITQINGALNIIKQLNGIQFDYKSEVFNPLNLNLSVKENEMLDKSRKNYLGFLAQDVQKVLAQVVSYDDSSDIYSIDYSKIIPVLVEAIKEQQARIDILTELIYNNEGDKKNSQETVSINGEDGIVSYLSQNTPNPFSKSTRIGYYLSKNNKKAMINIYDLNGHQLKTKPVSQTGLGIITIDASELQPGIYIYSLISGGNEVDTKRMILTE